MTIKTRFIVFIVIFQLFCDVSCDQKTTKVLSRNRRTSYIAEQSIGSNLAKTREIYRRQTSIRNFFNKLISVGDS